MGRFFEDYKKNENKEVKVDEFLGAEVARKTVTDAMVSVSLPDTIEPISENTFCLPQQLQLAFNQSGYPHAFPQEQCVQLSWSAREFVFAGSCLLLKLIRTHDADANGWGTSCSKCMKKTTCPKGRGDTPDWPRCSCSRSYSTQHPAMMRCTL